MEVKVLDGKLFSNVLMNVDLIGDDVVLEFSKEGLKFSLMDRAHVLFMGAEIKNTAFEGLEELDEQVNICVDANFMSKILKRIGKDELILKYDNGNLTISTITANRRSFKIPLIDTEYEPKRPPSLNPPFIFDIPYNYLKEVLGDISTANGNVIHFCAGEDGLTMYGASNMGEKAEAYYSPDGWVCEDTYSSDFSINYMDIIMKFKLGDNITMHLDTDNPLIMDLQDDCEDYNVSFLLAPRLEKK